MWAVRLLRRASLSPSFKSLSDLTRPWWSKKVRFSADWSCFFWDQQFSSCIRWERTFFGSAFGIALWTCVRMRGCEGNSCWGSERAHAGWERSTSAPVVCALFAMHQWTDRKWSKIDLITRFAHLWSRTFNQQSCNHSFVSEQFTEACTLLFFWGKISCQLSPSIMLAKE